MEMDLPSPPIPTINDTFSKYLMNLKSILSYTQFKITEKLVKKFIESRDSQQLQKLLELHASHNENWVTDLWLDDMYLRNQVPLPVNSNPAFLLPRQKFDNHLEMLWFAAHFIQFTKLFNTRIQNQQLEQDSIVKKVHQVNELKDNNNNQIVNKSITADKENNLDSINVINQQKINNNQSTINQTSLVKQSTSKTIKQPLCMQTYKNIFKAYRRPGDDKDELILNQDSKYNHIVIACKNQFFALSLTADQMNSNNELFIDYIYSQLIIIWEFCSKLDDKDNKKLKQQPVGLYTTEHRQTWWRIRNNLIKKSQNLQSLTCIEKCLVVLCLDDLIGQSTSKTHIDEADQLSRLLHGSQKYSSNRWFDKFLNIIIGTDGVFGFLMEHSASEGLPVIRYGEEFLNYWTDVKDKKPNLTKLKSSSTKTNLIRSFSDASNDKLISPGQVIHLQWQLDAFDKSKLNEAKEHLKSLIEGVDLNVQHFNGFGANWIKKNQISPDCFVQLALQITFYKLRGNLTSTYESGSLRRFKYGRVDNIRSNTIEALLLSRAICGESSNLTKQEKVTLFRNAIAKQVEIMKETVSGYGIDNHILGIREMSMKHQSSLLIRSNSESSDNTGLTTKKQKTDNLPEIFTTHAFKQFVDFQLSTSQVASSKGIVTAYGAVVRNGFGCCYNILSDKITFMVSSFLGGYNVSTNTYNNYNSNYSCSDSNISRSKMFSDELIETFKELENLIIIDLNNNSIKGQ